MKAKLFVAWITIGSSLMLICPPVLAQEDKERPDGPVVRATVTLLLSLACTLAPLGAGIAVLENAGSKDWGEQNLGWTLVGVGALVGPSVGQYVLGNVGTGLLFTGGRALSVGGVFLGGLVAYAGDSTAGILLAIVAGGGFLTFTIWDMVDSTRTAIERRKQARSLVLSPMLLPPPASAKDLSLGCGLALSGRF
jgi:hypothetical protein